jgi:hypothetical protein
MLYSSFKEKFDDKARAEALSIAWRLLVAADHPATYGSSGNEVRERMANRIRLSADMARDEDDLWVAALNEVQFEASSATSPTALLAKIWETSAGV